jgi:hypothetical protein
MDMITGANLQFILSGPVCQVRAALLCLLLP